MKTSTIPDRVKTVKQIECIRIECRRCPDGKTLYRQNMSGKRKATVKAHREEKRKLCKALKKMGVLLWIIRWVIIENID